MDKQIDAIRKACERGGMVVPTMDNESVFTVIKWLIVKDYVFEAKTIFENYVEYSKL